ncbi:hypothetical protein PV517_16070 [Streptomyces griseiscabiei]|uniref:Uncharacterized protein n=1 Tax=Streptomyces griseiscabiei TaxID=2993540 RepID=A0ABU4L3G9_9ACTN|nr:hypothetical protein [Streptomyces griseiscabiei]MDX2910217.1 hypothetical protein [Streptomyces griseiscabiei]
MGGVADLGSVQRALGVLQPLLLDHPAPAAAPRTDHTTADHTTTEPASTPAPAPAPADDDIDTGPSGGAGTGTDDTGTAAQGQKSYGRLTEQIMEYFAGVGDAEVRARDVAAALGRDTDSGSINGVRSTLDRLVGTARVRRAGRGLYRAGRP